MEQHRADAGDDEGEVAEDAEEKGVRGDDHGVVGGQQSFAYEGVERPAEGGQQDEQAADEETVGEAEDFGGQA